MSFLMLQMAIRELTCIRTGFLGLHHKLNDKSRMKREINVRFYESIEEKLLFATLLRGR